MSGKYHIGTRESPHRLWPVPRFSGIEFDGCIGCLRCVKRHSCVYDVHKQRRFDPAVFLDSADVDCVSCLRCVQECRKNILSRAANPLFEGMGDEYWKPEILAGIWKQSETGRIPVSGAGYRGPFTGPGFDAMWTDMSEIVRPTRDGIHGREYISTVIELGRKPDRLRFDAKSNLVGAEALFAEIPIPVVLDVPRASFAADPARQAVARAAGQLGTFMVASAGEAEGPLRQSRERLIVKFDPDLHDPGRLRGCRIVELQWGEGSARAIVALKAANPGIISSVRIPLDEHAAERAARLAAEGAEILHLEAGRNGRGLGRRQSAFASELVKEIHFRLVSDRVRERVTVLISGGIALAEHMAKIIICGVDGVGVDTALLVAMGCRLCPDCGERDICPASIDRVPVEWGAQRIVNLMGSWHSQLIEVLGAMGLREVRRLRGELGRAMFFEDLEKENFAPIFGNRIGTSAGCPEGPGAQARPGSAPRNGAPGRRAQPVIPQRAQVLPCPSRFRNRLAKHKVIRTSACIACGKCAEVCAFGVHVKGGGRMLAPRSALCRGADACRAAGRFCETECPVNALRVGPDPMWETFGDPRWTPELMVSTWAQAETGLPPESGMEYKVGASGGGFDRMDFRFPDLADAGSNGASEIDLSIPLNRRGDGRPEVVIGFPVYGGGMSFGSISLGTMLARARAYKAFDSFTCTGEGGYPDELKEYDDNVITQVATGLFGVREETIQRVRIVEFKYAQGAKPGLGGHLLGDKVTPAVARMREAVEGSSLFSPFPFHSVYSVEDHKKHVDWIKEMNPRALVSVKVSTPTDVDMVAVGSYCAGAHIIHLDGSYGGTGAAPDIAKKNIAMPIEYAIPKVHRFLEQEGVRREMTLMASGGIRTAWDAAKAIALGADGVVIGTAELVALECVRCGVCESGRGCPRGIATTDPELAVAFGPDWAAQRLINMFHSWCAQLADILAGLGLKSVRELTGRTEFLRHMDYEREKQVSGRSSPLKPGT